MALKAAGVERIFGLERAHIDLLLFAAAELGLALERALASGRPACVNAVCRPVASPKTEAALAAMGLDSASLSYCGKQDCRIRSHGKETWRDGGKRRIVDDTAVTSAGGSHQLASRRVAFAV